MPALSNKMVFGLIFVYRLLCLQKALQWNNYSWFARHNDGSKWCALRRIPLFTIPIFVFMDEAWQTMCPLGCEKSHWKLKYGVWMKLFWPFIFPIFMYLGEAWVTGNHPSWIREILLEAKMWGMGGVVLTFYSPNFHVYRWGLSSKKPSILDTRNPLWGPNARYGWSHSHVLLS
jgi:hypothetical protein